MSSITEQHFQNFADRENMRSAKLGAVIMLAGVSPSAMFRAMHQNIPFMGLIITFIMGFAISFEFHGVNAALNESGMAAVSILRFGYLGNPFLVETGPTAHVSPFVGYLQAAVFAGFGVNTQAARIVLSLVASVAYGLSAWLALKILIQHAGSRHWAPWLSLLVVCLPVFVMQTVIQVRQWDQPYAQLLLVAAWYVLDVLPSRSGRAGASLLLGCIIGAAFYVSASVLPALGVVALLHLARSRREAPLRHLVTIGLVASMLAAPWVIRNKIMLGEFILTRSNSGLELHVGNSPGSTGLSLESDGFEYDHPYGSEQAASLLRALGEVAYMKTMQRRATEWIKQQPLAFIDLTARRLLYLFVLPEGHTSWLPFVSEKGGWLIHSAFGVLRFAALAIALATGFRIGTIFGLTLLPILPYALFHLNYRYLSVVNVTGAIAIIMVALHLLDRRRQYRPAAAASTSGIRGDLVSPAASVR